jgi:hypothetical protein
MAAVKVRKRLQILRCDSPPWAVVTLIRSISELDSYQPLLTLFSPDLKEQGAGTFYEIERVIISHSCRCLIGHG